MALVEVSFFAMALAAVSTVASTLAVESAVTPTAPAAWTSVPVIVARVAAGSDVASPVPNRAATVLNRKFCDSQPSAFKARVTPTPTPFDAVGLPLDAPIDDDFWAPT